MGLLQLCRDPAMMDLLQVNVAGCSKVMYEASLLASLHVTRLLSEGEPVPRLNQTFFRQCISSIANLGGNWSCVKNNPSLYATVTQFKTLLPYAYEPVIRLMSIVCSMAYGGVRSSFCGALDPLQPLVPPDQSEMLGRATRLAAHDAELKRLYPNASVYLTIFESSRGLETNHGGVVFLGKRGFDIVTILRVRTCSSASRECFTQIVDDYRYEGEPFMTDALS